MDRTDILEKWSRMSPLTNHTDTKFIKLKKKRNEKGQIGDKEG